VDRRTHQAVLRFALYLAIPLGSWLGGALVERLEVERRLPTDPQ
jgi:hypothetical protein